MTKDGNGPTVIGLQVTGSTSVSVHQNAFAFYDRNDHILMRDVEIDNLNGQCIVIGHTNKSVEAYAG